MKSNVRDANDVLNDRQIVELNAVPRISLSTILLERSKADVEDAVARPQIEPAITYYLFFKGLRPPPIGTPDQIQRNSHLPFALNHVEHRGEYTLQCSFDPYTFSDSRRSSSFTSVEPWRPFTTIKPFFSLARGRFICQSLSPISLSVTILL